MVLDPESGEPASQCQAGSEMEKDESQVPEAIGNQAGPEAEGGEQDVSGAKLSRKGRLRGRVKTFITANFLPLGFLVGLIWALAWPDPGIKIASYKISGIRVVQAINNGFVFLISGLTLKSSDFRQAWKHWGGMLYGFVAILGITGLLGFAIRELPIEPAAFATGLTIFCIVPTTLGVGVALVTLSKGNQALALLLTIGTNMLGIVTMPYYLKAILRQTENVKIDPLDLFVKLVLTILVPVTIGKIMRSTCPPMRKLVARNKTFLSLFSTSNLICIVWQSLSGARDVLIHQAPQNVIIIILLAVAQHVVYLAFNTVIAWLCRWPLKESIAIVIMSSQKSAPVAVTLISYITKDLATQGILSIPGLCGQLVQIFLGSAIAKFLLKQVEKERRRSDTSPSVCNQDVSRDPADIS